MSAVDELPEEDADVDAPPRGKRRLRSHALVLLVVLVALVPVIGTGWSFSADEGALALQVERQVEEGRWVVPGSAPQIDPSDRAHPLELGVLVEEGVAPFTKHPLQVFLLLPLWELGGVTAAVLLSVVGTWLAAVGAALLGRRIQSGVELWALWGVGIGSPLLFDGYLLMGHALGAAAAAFAVLAVLRALEDGSSARTSATWVAAAGSCLAVGTLLRTEMLILAVALGGAVGLLGLRRRSLGWSGSAAALVLSAALADRFEGWWSQQIAGPDLTVRVPKPPVGFVEGRISAFEETWLGTGSAAERAPLLLLGLLLVAACAVLLRSGRPSRQWAPVGFAAVAALVLAHATSSAVVPGLLLATPLLVVGVLQVELRPPVGLAPALVAATAALFALGVLATQYAKGGGGEWGGRFFALGLPLAGALAAAALVQRERTLAGSDARLLRVLCVALLLVSGLAAARSLRSSHDSSQALVEEVVAIAETTDVSSPLVVTDVGVLPRLAWPVFDEVDWLLARRGDMPWLLEQVGESGPERFVLVSRQSEAFETAQSLGFEAGETIELAGSWQAVVLSR